MLNCKIVYLEIEIFDEKKRVIERFWLLSYRKAFGAVNRPERTVDLTIWPSKGSQILQLQGYTVQALERSNVPLEISLGLTESLLDSRLRGAY